MPTDPIAHRSATDTSRIILLVLTVSLLLFVLLGFSALYFCRYMYIRRRRNNSPSVPGVAPPPPQALDEAVGLDSSVVASFPTFTYSCVKNLHAGKYDLECAVCLSEFDDDDVLRLLTACSHVFHTNCIDVWLMSHTTCPYCRHELNHAAEKKASPEVRILVGEAGDAQAAFEESGGGGEESEQQQQQQSNVQEEEEEGKGEEEGEEVERSGGDLKRMVRSNSTGHSSMGGGREADRFTLRLPKDVKERIARVRNWTGSCVDFGYFIGDVKDDDADVGRSRFSDTLHSRM